MAGAGVVRLDQARRLGRGRLGAEPALELGLGHAGPGQPGPALGARNPAASHRTAHLYSSRSSVLGPRSRQLSYAAARLTAIDCLDRTDLGVHDS